MTTSIKKIFLLCTVLWFMTGCADFLDVNMDPNNPTTTAPNNLLPAILANSATITFNAGEIGTYYAQQLSTEFGNNSTRDLWDFRREVRVGIFRHHYFDVGGNAFNMIQEAGKDNISMNYQGVGKIMLAFSFLTTTDVLGDMPFHEAFSGKDSPKYDTQDVIYEGIEKMLDEAIVHLQAAMDAGAAVRPMTANNDPVFRGDLNAWKAFAHGLKARLLIHKSNHGVDFNKVIEQVDLALQGWKAPSYPFNGSDDWTRNPWGPLQARPMLFSMRPNYLAFSAPSTFFMSFMQDEDYTDPRAYKHFTPNEGGEIIGIVSGRGREAIPRADLPGLYDNALTGDNSPIEYMVKAELYFIKAEAAFMLNNKPLAYTNYLAGINADMDRLGVEQADRNEYLNNADFVVNNENNITLSHIITQKMIALYLQPEAWVDMRRHDYSDEVYPGLTRPESVDQSIFGEDKWIARIPYNMETEYIYNLPEIDRLGAKEASFLAVKLWWMQN
ncbi:MAG: SusD/RagB family nutrient-binding outer membrane lipoprotein [Cyclobacteriaceae bacterium]